MNFTFICEGLLNRRTKFFAKGNQLVLELTRFVFEFYIESADEKTNDFNRWMNHRLGRLEFLKD